jgi:hypothetical protein
MTDFAINFLRFKAKGFWNYFSETARMIPARAFGCQRSGKWNGGSGAKHVSLLQAEEAALAFQQFLIERTRTP